MNRLWRVVDLSMVALFALATLVQFNDPDPIRWIAIYGAVVLLSALVLTRRRLSPYLPGALALLSVGWALSIVVSGPGWSEYGHMFDAWEMKSLPIEEAREASGLLLAALWMAALSYRARRTESTFLPDTAR
jgi:hypothetical protein